MGHAHPTCPYRKSGLAEWLGRMAGWHTGPCPTHFVIPAKAGIQFESKPRALPTDEVEFAFHDLMMRCEAKPSLEPWAARALPAHIEESAIRA